MDIELKERTTAGKYGQLIRNAAKWMYDHADDLTDDLDKMNAIGDELHLDVCVGLHCFSTVSIDREYVVM